MEEITEKIRTLARFVKQNPGDSFSKFALALEFMKKNEHQRARVLFESIRKQDPEYLGVYYHLGKLYQRFGELEKAQKSFEKGLQLAEMKDEKRTREELEEALQQLKEDME